MSSEIMTATTALLLYIPALLFLILRILKKRKRDMIFSSGLITLASLYGSLTIASSVLWIFTAAMVLSFIGDLLMAQVIKITQHRTIDGAMAFGIAHILYITAFIRLSVGHLSFAELWWILVIGAILLLVLYQKIGYNEELPVELNISNFIYAVLIVGAFIFVFRFSILPFVHTLIRLTALLGSILFVISDGVLAYNEFQNPIPGAKDIIAITYLGAQILLQITPLLLIVL